MEGQDVLAQLRNILDDQDTFLVKLPHSLKQQLAGGEDFENMTGEIFSRMMHNPEKNGHQTSKGMEFDLQLNLGSNQSNQINTMGQDTGNRYFDLNLPSMDELIESKKRARTGTKEPIKKTDE